MTIFEFSASEALACPALSDFEHLGGILAQVARCEEMTMTNEPTDIEDRIQPRSRAVTEKIEAQNPWLTIAPDEETVRQHGIDADPPSYAELIRMTTSLHGSQRRD